MPRRTQGISHKPCGMKQFGKRVHRCTSNKRNNFTSIRTPGLPELLSSLGCQGFNAGDILQQLLRQTVPLL